MVEALGSPIVRLPEGVRLAALEPAELPEARRLLADQGVPVDADVLDPPSGTALGVFAGGALAGVAALASRPGEGGAIFLEAMAVRALDRGRGLGRALVEASAGVARARDFDLVEAGCAIDAHAQQTWLERSGFRLYGIVPEPSPSGERLAFRVLYARVVAPAASIRWPLPAALTPRVAALVARLWGDPPPPPAQPATDASCSPGPTSPTS